MTLKSQIEIAKDAVSKALITALENKDEYVISSLFTCYNTLNNIKTKESFKIDMGKSSGIYTNYNTAYSTNNTDVISFTGLG